MEKKKRIVFRRKRMIRSNDESELYALKRTFDIALKYIQRDMDITSADLENNHTSAKTENMQWFMQYLWRRIDELDDKVGNNKNWGSF